jgi:Pyridoxamine 5'-phosphate oxidase
VTSLPEEARRILGEGTLCYLAACAPTGLHVTPVVFALDGRRLWATTARRAVKARAWKRDPRAAGLVRLGDRAVSFRGAVTLYDSLDPLTWPASILRGPVLARAWTRFSLKNARFFAGYARDAHRVPLSWTPPGRVVVSIDLDHGVVLDLAGGEVVDRWGRWGASVAGRASFRTASRPALSELRIPDELQRVLGSAGIGALGIEAPLGPVVLPTRWAELNGDHVAVLPRAFLALGQVEARVPVALLLDRASAWRAAQMRGVLLRGEGDVYLPDEVSSGRRSLMRLAAHADPLPPDPAVVHLRARSAVWWEGWSSGTVIRS